MNDTTEKDAQQQGRRRQHGLEILTDKEGEVKQSCWNWHSKNSQQDGKTEKEGETDEEVVISCAGGKREFKQNMKKEIFAGTA